MKSLFKILTIFLSIMFCSVVLAANMTKTLTFQWEQSDKTNLKEWKLLWSDTQGGPYVDLATIPYDGTAGPTFTSDADAQITGNQGTHVIKYFVLRACGDIPQETGDPKYECSVDSNEASYDFWIPSGKFSVPVTFEIISN